MLSNKLVCLFVILCSFIYMNQAKPYHGGNYGYGFPSVGFGGYGGGLPGYASKPYGGYNNLGYGFPNPMGYQHGLMSYPFNSGLNKHKGYLGNSGYGGGYSPYNRYSNGLFGFLG